jgi:SAM-dependent methyltransferase
VDPVAIVVWLGIAGVAFCASMPGAHAALVMLGLASTAGTVWLWHRDRLSTAQVLAGAVAARFLFLPLEPSLTDDTFRYVWDGWLQWEGINPYEFRPSAVVSPEDGTMGSELYQRLNSKEFFSVYPPISQMVFAFGASVDALIGESGSWRQSYFAIKSVFVLLEIAGLALLARMLAARWLVLYAWSPLVVLETAGQGHTEAALVFFLIAAVWAVRAVRPGLASLALTGAALVKLYPVLLFPLLVRRFGWRSLLPGAVAGALLCLPYAEPFVIPNVLTSLDLYVRLFEFFAGPYFLAKHVLLEGTGTDYSKILGPAFRAVFLLGVPVVYLWDARSELPFHRSALWILGGFLVLSTTVHPWYLLAVLPLAVLAAGRSSRRGESVNRVVYKHTMSLSAGGLAGWLWLSAAALGTYTFYAGGPYWTWVIGGWGGALVLWVWTAMPRIRKAADHALQHLQRRRGAEKADRILRWLSPSPGRHGVTPGVLDLGAGEGYVGQAIQDSLSETKECRIGTRVQLCDVIDLNRTDLPHDTYNGTDLPYRENAFDSTILYFVLHHCQDAERVLQEALRVTRGRVIVVESVIEGPLQHRVLRIVDRWANRIRSAGVMRAQEDALSFRSVQGWEKLVRMSGGTVVHRHSWGNAVHPQALLVIEPSARADSAAETSTASLTSSTSSS